MRFMALGLGAVAIAGSAALLAPPAGQSPTVASAETASSDAQPDLVNLIADPSSDKGKPKEVSARGTNYHVAPNGSGISGPGKVEKYLVEVEKGIKGISAADFAEAVDDRLMDHRSWGNREGRALQRVSKGPVEFRVSLTKASSVDRMCFPRQTASFVSCFMYGRAIINEERWLEGAPDFKKLADYRTYLINHEVGHGLGKGHWFCPPSGGPGRLMMQQTFMTADSCGSQQYAAPKASRFRTECTLRSRLRDGQLMLRGKVSRTPFRQKVKLSFQDQDGISQIGEVSTTTAGKFAVELPTGDLTPSADTLQLEFTGTRDLGPCETSLELTSEA
ncbi:MAG: DUF3152 domain-containing protein [Actinomycetia bacterium]|nr:DUF3152 domain-containing protein [Actinomycetes bacterium]